MLPDLVQNLNAGLDAIQWEGDDRSKFTKRLISTHMLAIRMTQPAALEVATDADDENAADEALKELDQRRADKLLLRPFEVITSSMPCQCKADRKTSKFIGPDV